MTALRNQTWIGAVSSVQVDETNPNWINVEAVIPATDGGFYIREIGIFNEANVLLAVGKLPETYKPSMESGSTKDLYLKAIFEVTNASVVSLKADPSVVLASKKYVDDKVSIVSRNFTTLQQQVTQHLDHDATKTEKGHVQIGDGLNISDGTVSVDKDFVHTSGTALLTGDDLDSLLTPGIYYASNAAIYNSLLNKPSIVASAGALITVTNSTNNVFIQHIKVAIGTTTSTTKTYREFVRSFNSSFSEWTMVVHSLFGSTSPEGVVSAPIGSQYINLNGGQNTTLYVKVTGTGNTGWLAK